MAKWVVPGSAFDISPSKGGKSDVDEDRGNEAPEWLSPLCDLYEQTTGDKPKSAGIFQVRNQVIRDGENNWDGLPRQIMMWLDFGVKTPRALFSHLERTGYEIPQWLRDEPEMKHLDHVPSKGTRAVIIFKAMVNGDKRLD